MKIGYVSHQLVAPRLPANDFAGPKRAQRQRDSASQNIVALGIFDSIDDHRCSPTKWSDRSSRRWWQLLVPFGLGLDVLPLVSKVGGEGHDVGIPLSPLSDVRISAFIFIGLDDDACLFQAPGGRGVTLAPVANGVWLGWGLLIQFGPTQVNT